MVRPFSQVSSQPDHLESLLASPWINMAKLIKNGKRKIFRMPEQTKIWRQDSKNLDARIWALTGFKLPEGYILLKMQ